METYVHAMDCLEFIKTLEDKSVSLFLIDPPYYKIVKNSWDNQWKSIQDYVDWMYQVFVAIKPKLKENASVIFFGGVGKHGERPLFKLMDKIEENNLFYYRNFITWKKRRGYGKEFDYLFTREEIVWYSNSPERTQVIFNIPLLEEKRGYAGFDKLHPAKSEFKRRSNVWIDINELFKTTRSCEKPIKLLECLIKTHSNQNDLIVDTFAGTGSAGIAAINLKRKFLGCEIDKETAILANNKIFEAQSKFHIL